MLQSHVIHVDGVFVSAAISLDRGYRVVAVDLRLYRYRFDDLPDAD